jgi:sugar-phosphatase
VLAVAPGSPAERTVRHVRPDLSDDQVTAAAAAARQLAPQYEDLSDVTAAPGARELLAELDRLGLPWAVVTSADAKLARLRLAAAGLLVPVLITVEDVRAGKPDPEGYLLAARTLAAEPGRCLVVEDAEPGVLAGQAASATVAALKGVPADLAIADLYQLIAKIIIVGSRYPSGGNPSGGSDGPTLMRAAVSRRTGS